MNPNIHVFVELIHLICMSCYLLFFLPAGGCTRNIHTEPRLPQPGLEGKRAGTCRCNVSHHTL